MTGLDETALKLGQIEANLSRSLEVRKEHSETLKEMTKSIYQISTEVSKHTVLLEAVNTRVTQLEEKQKKTENHLLFTKGKAVGVITSVGLFGGAVGSAFSKQLYQLFTQ